MPLLERLERGLETREAAQVEAGGNLGLLTPAAAMAAFSPALWTGIASGAPKIIRDSTSRSFPVYPLRIKLSQDRP